MALSLDTIVTVAALVRGAVDLYNRIEDWPDQMKKLGRRIKNLDVYLSELEEIVAKKPNSAFSRLFSTQKKHLGLLLQDIRKDTESINALFHRWENDVGPLGFQFRFKTLTQAYFALGSSSDKIAALIEDVNDHLQGIRDYLTLMGFKAAVLIGETQNAKVPPTPVLGKPVKAPAGEKKDAKNKKKPSPSPSPAPPRTDFKILFVDPANLGRSVVGEAVTKLMKESTKASKGDWRIQTIHSAGLRIKDKTDVPEIESLKRDIDGGRSPVGLGLDAVFENKAFDVPAKKDVHIAMLKKRSNGVKKDMFRRYDFILVFTSLDHERVLKIKSALVEKEGAEQVTVKGKGRVLHLGSYLTLDGIPREIEDPKQATKEAKATRADWNWKVAQIKLAVKEFLKQEMQWKTPAVQKLDEMAAIEQKVQTREVSMRKGEEKKPPEPRDVGKVKDQNKAAVQELSIKATIEDRFGQGGKAERHVVAKKELEHKETDDGLPHVDDKPAGKKSADKKIAEGKREDKKGAHKKVEVKKPPVKNEIKALQLK